LHELRYLLTPQAQAIDPAYYYTLRETCLTTGAGFDYSIALNEQEISNQDTKLIEKAYQYIVNFSIWTANCYYGYVQLKSLYQNPIRQALTVSAVSFYCSSRHTYLYTAQTALIRPNDTSSSTLNRPAVKWSLAYHLTIYKLTLDACVCCGAIFDTPQAVEIAVMLWCLVKALRQLTWALVILIVTTVVDTVIVNIISTVGLRKFVRRHFNIHATAGASTATTVATQTAAISIPGAPRQRMKRKDVTSIIDMLSLTDWLPIQARCLAKGTCTMVDAAQLCVTLTVHDTMTLETLNNILQHTTVIDLQLACADLSDSMLAALSQRPMQQLLTSRLVTCSLHNVEKLSIAALKALIEGMPTSLHKLCVSQAKAIKDSSLFTDAVTIPSSVKQLTLTQTSWATVLPEGLEVLHVHRCSTRAWRNLPSTLRELYMYDVQYELPQLPQGLLVLSMHCSDAAHVDLQLSGVIPDTVTRLRLAESQEQRVTQWPPNLVALDVGSNYYHHLGALPASLRELTLKAGYERVYFNKLDTLPEGLKVLDVANIGFPIERLPQQLEVFKLDLYTSAVPELPQSLKQLRIAGYGHRHLVLDVPAALEVLDVGFAYGYCQQLDNGSLPASLQTLHVSEKYKPSLSRLHQSVKVHRVSPRWSSSSLTVW
jgi:hypothetical protein